MNKGIACNILKFLCIIILSGFAAVYSFQNPENIENASKSAISALSIIFGLSTAISSVITSRSAQDFQHSNAVSVSKRQLEIAEKDDDRTRSRQKVLHLLTLCTVILGLLYLVAVKHSPCAPTTRLSAAVFSFGMTLSFLFSLQLPSLIASLSVRNRFLGR